VVRLSVVDEIGVFVTSTQICNFVVELLVRFE
jgi:hypothetical protein